MSAQSKQELVALSDKEFAKFTKLIGDIDAETANWLGEDGISVKDTVAHRAHWVGLMLGWYADARAGKPVHTPAPGYKWSELKTYNAKVREAARGQSWDQVRADLAAAHARLMDLIDGLDDTVLYGERLYDWMNDWTLGRWAEASGPSHYRSACKYIRKLLRERAGA